MAFLVQNRGRRAHQQAIDRMIELILFQTVFLKVLPYQDRCCSNCRGSHRGTGGYREAVVPAGENISANPGDFRLQRQAVRRSPAGEAGHLPGYAAVIPRPDHSQFPLGHITV